MFLEVLDDFENHKNTNDHLAYNLCFTSTINNTLDVYQNTF